MPGKFHQNVNWISCPVNCQHLYPHRWIHYIVWMILILTLSILICQEQVL